MITEKELAGIERVGSIKRYHVEKGLYLIVQKIGSKGQDTWQGRYREGDKERRVVLGKYPQISLGEARERLESIKGNITQGIPQDIPQLNFEELLADLHLDIVEDIDNRLSNITQRFDQLEALIKELSNSIPKASDKPIEPIIDKPIGEPILPCHRPPPVIPNLIGTIPSKRKPNHFEPDKPPRW
jgi:hypothetical protein